MFGLTQVLVSAPQNTSLSIKIHAYLLPSELIPCIKIHAYLLPSEIIPCLVWILSTCIKIFPNTHISQRILLLALKIGGTRYWQLLRLRVTEKCPDFNRPSADDICIMIQYNDAVLPSCQQDDVTTISSPQLGFLYRQDIGALDVFNISYVVMISNLSAYSIENGHRPLANIAVFG